jgi:hypothetical protein
MIPFGLASPERYFEDTGVRKVLISEERRWQVDCQGQCAM